VEITVRETAADDLEFVLSAERAPEAVALVGQWTRERHLDAIARRDEEHLTIVGAGVQLGFAILQGIGGPNDSIEVRRIVVVRRGEGIGRRALALVVDRAFAVHGANRVWLDTFTGNERAQRAYAAAGFVGEGVLREALLKNGRYESLVVMSILRSEWRAESR
jgi:diamine N-acetyltransferase